MYKFEGGHLQTAGMMSHRNHILSARLAEAYAMKNMAVQVPVAKLADDKQSTADEGLKLQAKID